MPDHTFRVFSAGIIKPAAVCRLSCTSYDTRRPGVIRPAERVVFLSPSAVGRARGKLVSPSLYPSPSSRRHGAPYAYLILRHARTHASARRVIRKSKIMKRRRGPAKPANCSVEVIIHTLPSERIQMRPRRPFAREHVTAAAAAASLTSTSRGGRSNFLPNLPPRPHGLSRRGRPSRRQICMRPERPKTRLRNPLIAASAYSKTIYPPASETTRIVVSCDIHAGYAVTGQQRGPLLARVPEFARHR